MASTATSVGSVPGGDVETEINPNITSMRDAASLVPGGARTSEYSMTEMSPATVAPSRQDDAPRPWSLPGLGHLGVGRQIQVLSAVLVVSLVAAACVVYYDARTAGRLAVANATATGMQMLSQRLANAAQQAVVGEPIGFDRLQESRDRFERDLGLLREGGASLAPATGPALEVLREIEGRWTPLAADADLILEQRDNLLELRAREETIAQSVPRIQRLTEQLASLAATPAESYQVRTLVLQLEADVQNYNFAEANRLLSTERPNPRVAFQLGKNVRRFHDELRTLLAGPGAVGGVTIKAQAALATARDLEAEFAPFAASVEGILANMQPLAAAKQASRDIFADSEDLLLLPGRLAAVYTEQGRRRMVPIGIAIALGLIALGCVILIGRVYVEDARARAAQSDRDYRRNQEAIIRLLDEMQGLAEGNLTIRARVTDDITGAIADAVNFAVEELREVVGGINDASTELAQATQDAGGISARLLLAAKRQTDEIRSTTASVLGIAKSIKKVSDRSDECVSVAERSLVASEKGAAAVQASISGMNAIREQIQETAKRIKRLGESSQEIGEIVELIADITEQTNVLALNAAIQAASAGAAGRGFSVVAEEVQRLAERSGEATQQIAAIVKTIQTDTQDTVLAMEKSTQGVVEGARVSDAAGQALSQIGTVSRQLAEKVEGISASTREQVELARKAAMSMHDILKITEQTAAGTRRTNASMERVSELATGLSDSVSGFRL